MKTWRKRTGKKKGKFTEPDEFQSFTQRAILYVQENTKKVYAALAAAAVVAVIIVVVTVIMNASRKKVQAEVTEAMKYYDISSPVPGNKPLSEVERFKKAAELFGKVAAEHGGPTGDIALYYKANSEMEVANMDAAIKDYKELLGRAPDDPALVPLVNNRLAAAYIEKGDNKSAMEAYMSNIKAKDGYMKDEAHFRLGGIYQKTGSKEQAIKEYNTVVKEFPSSPWAVEAKLHIAQLGGGASTVAGGGAPAGVLQQAAPAMVIPAPPAPGAAKPQPGGAPIPTAPQGAAPAKK